jgi:hypothetical protein
MTDIDEKEAFRQIGMSLINEYRVQHCLTPISWLAIDTPEVSAFIRSIQLHEKTKQELADFKQKVSDAAERAVEVIDHWSGDRDGADFLQSFITHKPKPDPLVEFVTELNFWEYADKIRAALDALGLEITEKKNAE